MTTRDSRGTVDVAANVVRLSVKALERVLGEDGTGPLAGAATRRLIASLYELARIVRSRPRTTSGGELARINAELAETIATVGGALDRLRAARERDAVLNRRGRLTLIHGEGANA